ncbi:unnamed protein product [Ilex paraguariensis]|uniref:Uncharacterized protein n=1 Tax=Ilex paraguariensis TaxID=185542 RepID=A0ABC8RD60_9AQUA
MVSAMIFPQHPLKRGRDGFRNDFSANNPLKRGRDGFRNDFSNAVNNNDNNKRQRISDGEVPAGINSSPPHLLFFSPSQVRRQMI